MDRAAEWILCVAPPMPVMGLLLAHGRCRGQMLRLCCEVARTTRQGVYIHTYEVKISSEVPFVEHYQMIIIHVAFM